MTSMTITRSASTPGLSLCRCYCRRFRDDTATPHAAVPGLTRDRNHPAEAVPGQARDSAARSQTFAQMQRGTR